MANSFRFTSLGKCWTRRVTMICMVLLASSAAVGSDACGTLDRAVNAIHMAELLYPELKGKELSLQFAGARTGPLGTPTDATYLVVAVDKPAARSSGQTSEPSDNELGDVSKPELPLYLQFDFVRTVFDKVGNRIGTELTCQPWEFSNTVGSKQLHEAWDVINAHPEWTDEQDLKAARKVGMRFGPEKKADLLRMLPLKELSSIYGPLRVTKASLKIASLKEPGASFADLHWYITAKRVGSKKTLAIMVEPFHGRIISISE